MSYNKLLLKCHFKFMGGPPHRNLRILYLVKNWIFSTNILLVSRTHSFTNVLTKNRKIWLFIAIFKKSNARQLYVMYVCSKYLCLWCLQLQNKIKNWGKYFIYSTTVYADLTQLWGGLDFKIDPPYEHGKKM